MFLLSHGVVDLCRYQCTSGEGNHGFGVVLNGLRFTFAAEQEFPSQEEGKRRREKQGEQLAR